MAKDSPIAARRAPYKVTLEAGKRYAWCACGRSANQPFCDGAHKVTDIVPVVFIADKTEDAFLCGCKATSGQPRCDGTHSTLED